MMSFPSHVILSELLSVEQQLGELHRHAAEATTAFMDQQAGPAMAALARVNRLASRVTVLVSQLKARVVEVDRALICDDLEALGELALRAEAIAVPMLLRELEVELGPQRGTPKAQGLFVGRFHWIDDVTTFVTVGLDRVNELWTRHRWHDLQLAALTAGRQPRQEERRLAYRETVRRADRAMCAIGTQPDFIQFLQSGSRLLDWPEVSSPCGELAAVFRVAPSAALARPTGDNAHYRAPRALTNGWQRG